MFPEVRREPARACRPHAPGAIDRSGTVPKVGIVVFHPAFVNTPMHLGGLFALLDHGLHLVNQRPCTFAEVRRFGQPVVHFEVDVGGVLTSPNRARVLVPDTLQVRGLAALTGACDEQVTAILIMEFHKRRVVGGIEVLHTGRGDVACARIGCAQVQRNTVENCLVIFEVRREQVVVRFFGHLRHNIRGDRARVARDIVVRLEIRSRGEHEHCRVCALHRNVPVRN